VVLASPSAWWAAPNEADLSVSNIFWSTEGA